MRPFLFICFFAGAVIMVIATIDQHIHGYYAFLGFILMAIPIGYCIYTGKDLD